MSEPEPDDIVYRLCVRVDASNTQMAKWNPGSIILDCSVCELAIWVHETQVLPDDLPAEPVFICTVCALDNPELRDGIMASFPQMVREFYEHGTTSVWKDGKRAGAQEGTPDDSLHRYRAGIRGLAEHVRIQLRPAVSCASCDCRAQ